MQDATAAEHSISSLLSSPVRRKEQTMDVNLADLAPVRGNMGVLLLAAFVFAAAGLLLSIGIGYGLALDGRE